MSNDMITVKNVAPGKDLFSWTADASELGIPVGKLPYRLSTDLGNGRDFVLARWDANTFIYKQELGCITLTVFNT